jgi:hypothetical protein
MMNILLSPFEFLETGFIEGFDGMFQMVHLALMFLLALINIKKLSGFFSWVFISSCCT